MNTDKTIQEKLRLAQQIRSLHDNAENYEQSVIRLIDDFTNRIAREAVNEIKQELGSNMDYENVYTRAILKVEQKVKEE